MFPVAYGECDNRVYVPLIATGAGKLVSKRSASYPTIPGTLSPSLNPVPAYTQCPLFVTTYGAHPPAGPSVYSTPTSVCSGRLSAGSRQVTVFRFGSVVGSRL